MKHNGLEVIICSVASRLRETDPNAPLAWVVEYMFRKAFSTHSTCGVRKFSVNGHVVIRLHCSSAHFGITYFCRRLNLHIASQVGKKMGKVLLDTLGLNKTNGSQGFPGRSIRPMTGL